MSSDKTTPLIDHEANCTQEDLITSKRGCCKSSITGLLLAFTACVFFFLVIGIMKYTYTLYPFLSPMDMQVSYCVIPLFCSIQAAIKL